MIICLILTMLVQPVSAPLLVQVPAARQTRAEKSFAQTLLDEEPGNSLSSIIVRVDLSALDAQRVLVPLPGGEIEFGNPPTVMKADGLLRRTWSGPGNDMMYLDFVRSGHDDSLQILYGMVRARGRWYSVSRTGGRNYANAISDLTDQNVK